MNEGLTIRSEPNLMEYEKYEKNKALIKEYLNDVQLRVKKMTELKSKYKRKDNFSQISIMAILGIVSVLELLSFGKNELSAPISLLSGILNIITLSVIGGVRYMKWQSKADFSKVVLIMTQDLETEIRNHLANSDVETLEKYL
eukprot:Pgem_evm2s2154